jgi:iron complex transport system substrate-binding protein
MMRICSLIPGATEVVALLGRTGDLVGISYACDYPPEVRSKPVVLRARIEEGLASQDIHRRVKATVESGQSLYELDETVLARVRPDLMITQDLCRVCAITSDQLSRALHSFPTPPRILSLSPSTLDAVLADIEQIGEAIGQAQEARELVERLRARLEAILLLVARMEEQPRVACLEWLDPLYNAGHWVPEMVAYAGGVDVLSRPGAPSAQITWDQVLAAQPDVLVLMPCGFSIARIHQELDRLTSRPGWNDLPAVRRGRVFLVEASAYFNRPGPRLIDGVEILAACFHPALTVEIPAGAVQRLGGPASPALGRLTPVP